MLIHSKILTSYLGRRFFFWSIMAILLLAGILCLFDVLDLLRRILNKTKGYPGLAVHITFLHIPYFILTLMPFSLLLGGIVCFWQLNRSSELIITRTTGLSPWRFLMGPIGMAFLMGIIATTLISPISAAFFAQAEYLDKTLIQNVNAVGPLNIGKSDIWLRQTDKEFDLDGNAIIHAQRVYIQNGTVSLQNVSILRIDSQNSLKMKILAPRANLASGQWLIEHPKLYQPGKPVTSADYVSMTTTLTLSQMQENFASPNSLSFWTLPGFIHRLNVTGFSSVRHNLYYQTLLALPILCAVMTMIAACFSIHSIRAGSLSRTTLMGVITGFVLFAFSRICEQLANSSILPVILAAWAPTIAGLCLAVTLITHQEDG